MKTPYTNAIIATLKPFRAMARKIIREKGYSAALRDEEYERLKNQKSDTFMVRSVVESGHYVTFIDFSEKNLEAATCLTKELKAIGFDADYSPTNPDSVRINLAIRPIFR